MNDNFDLNKAYDLLRERSIRYRKKYYPERYHTAYKNKNIPENLEPKYWVNKSETIVYDFARLIQYALKEADHQKISYEAIENIVHYFEDFCLMEKGILVNEIRKESNVFRCLLDNEYDSIDVPFSNVTRKHLDFWLDNVLNKQKVLNLYEMTVESNYLLITSANMINEDKVNAYLQRRLVNEEGDKWIDLIISALGENNVECFGLIFERIIDKFADQVDVQEALIDYSKHMRCDNSIKLLTMLKDKPVTNIRYVNDLAESIDVALCMLEKGEAGLLHLYETTNVNDIKYKILSYYKYFRSQSFAQILVNSLEDTYMLEYGYYPIRANAYYNLKEEPSTKIMEWFGYDIIDVLYSTFFEEH